ncbi:MAG: DUF2384 domain-containing protein [Rubrivivax sp.]|nr:MAG: DUF2384 domain-containing protein [Rubrivivax sp.]
MFVFLDFDGTMHPVRSLTEAMIRNMATSVLGSQDAAAQWLLRPAMGLNQSRPIDLLKSTEGIIMVADLLTRMEYGVYA